MTLDEQIAHTQATRDEAKKRGDTRAQHAAEIDLQRLVHRRMRRDKRKGLFRAVSRAVSDAAQAVVLIAGGVAAYCIACPLDAFAAEIVTVERGPSGLQIAALATIFGLVIAMTISALMNARNLPGEDDQ